jgi:NAD+ kinase
MNMLSWLAEYQGKVDLLAVRVHESGVPQGIKLPMGGVCDDEGLRKSDLVVVLGGDGTLLWAVRILEDYEVPILGINVCNLGFLTEVPLEDLPLVLGKALKGQAQLEYRSMLAAFLVREGTRRALGIALNDVVVARGPAGRLMTLEVFSGDTFVNRYRADGLILASSTGSTAYNLASGGPILSPNVEAVVITPICPHTLSNRALVIPSETTLHVRLEQEPIKDTQGSCVILDGQKVVELTSQDELIVGKSRHRMCLVKNPALDYFQIVRTKLRWG